MTKVNITRMIALTKLNEVNLKTGSKACRPNTQFKKDCSSLGITATARDQTACTTAKNKPKVKPTLFLSIILPPFI